MGRRNTRWTSNVCHIFVIGEQLRKQMHAQGQVKDRRHHLRKHKQCFIGRDVVDWLLKMHHVQSRDEAMQAMQILKQNDVFHHVTNEHEFKDQNVFYRFSYDDGTFKANVDLTSFYWGLDIYRRLKANGGVMQEFYLKGSLYSEAFFGCDLVDFMLVNEGEETRESVTLRLRDLLEKDIVKHVTDDYHFCDDKLIYEFSLDFDKPCLLHEVVDLLAQRGTHDTTDSTDVLKSETTKSDAETTSSVHIKSTKTVSAAPRASIDSTTSGVSSSPGSSADEEGNITRKSLGLEPKSVLIRAATVEELEDPASPYTRSCLRIKCDVMGFGFVLRGCSPSYVQTIEPLGPAAEAGLRVRQFLYSVNGQNVLRMDHRQVGQLIGQTNEVSLTVLTYRCDAERR